MFDSCVHIKFFFFPKTCETGADLPVYVYGAPYQNSCLVFLFSFSHLLLGEGGGWVEINFPSQICIFPLRKEVSFLTHCLMVLKYFFPVCCDLEEQTPPRLHPHPRPPPVPVILYYLRCHLLSALFVNRQWFGKGLVCGDPVSSILVWFSSPCSYFFFFPCFGFRSQFWDFFLLSSCFLG